MSAHGSQLSYHNAKEEKGGKEEENIGGSISTAQ